MDKETRSTLLSRPLLWLFLPPIPIAMAAGFAMADESSLISAYRAACERIETTVASDSYRNASEEEKRDQLHNNLFKGIQRAEVVDAFRAITAAVPSEQYAILKEGIEEETGHQWECPALKEVMED